MRWAGSPRLHLSVEQRCEEGERNDENIDATKPEDIVVPSKSTKVASCNVRTHLTFGRVPDGRRRPLGRGAPITAPSFFRCPAGRPGSPNRRALSLIVSIVRIEPQPADCSQGARRRPPGVRNRPGRRWHRPSTRHRAAPKGFEGAIRSTPYGAALASGVTVQESHDQPPRVRIGMVFPVRQEFTIAVARKNITDSLGSSASL